MDLADHTVTRNSTWMNSKSPRVVFNLHLFDKPLLRCHNLQARAFPNVVWYAVLPEFLGNELAIDLPHLTSLRQGLFALCCSESPSHGHHMVSVSLRSRHGLCIELPTLKQEFV